MAIRDILIFPHPGLRKVAIKLNKVDEQARTLVDDMLETMYAAPGIGLAATQIDVHQRVLVIDVSEEKDEPLVFINPELSHLEGEEEMEEGCLSIPGFFETVTRAEKVMVTALDRNGDNFTLQADGLLAVCLQHEVDHLNGKMFVDYLSALKRNRIRSKLQKQQLQR